MAAILPAATPILLHAPGRERRVTWAAFASVNADSISPAELQLIQSVIEAGGTYFGGGGAEPVWTVRLAPTPTVEIAAARRRGERLVATLPTAWMGAAP